MWPLKYNVLSLLQRPKKMVKMLHYHYDKHFMKNEDSSEFTTHPEILQFWQHEQ